MALDVVVVNWHTPSDLAQFLDSYRRFPPAGAAAGGRLIVANVEAAPPDAAVVDRHNSRPHAPAHLVSFADNVGYARACNRAALDGGGDVVAFFNADVVLSAGALDGCYDAMAANPAWGVLGPRQVDVAGRLVASGVYGPPDAPRFAAWRNLDRGQCSVVRTDALTVAGSAYFVRRGVWDALTVCPLYRRAAPDAEGAFLPTPHYYEETYCSAHARAHGWVVVYYGPVCITHLWHRASPHGGPADQGMNVARSLYRAACDLHGIAHE